MREKGTRLIKQVSNFIRALSLRVKGIRDIRRLDTDVPAFNIVRKYYISPVFDQYQFYINTRAYGKGIRLVIRRIDGKGINKHFKDFNSFKKYIKKLFKKLYNEDLGWL